MRKVLVLLLATLLLLLVGGQVFGLGTTFKAVVKNDSVVTTSSYFTINLYCTNHDSIFDPPYENRTTWGSPFAFNGNISIDWIDAALTNAVGIDDTTLIDKFMTPGFFNYWDVLRFLLVKDWDDGVLPDRFAFEGIANDSGFPPQTDSILTLSWHAKTTNDSGYFCMEKGDMDNHAYDWLFDDPQPDFTMQCWNIEADTLRVFNYSVPVFDTIFDTIRVLEGATLTIPGTVLYEVGGYIGAGNAVIYATDPGKTLTLSYYSPPDDSLAGVVTFTTTSGGTDSITGEFVYKPNFTGGNRYETVYFIASNGIFADTEKVVIHVRNVNAPPVITNMGNKTVSEHDTLQIGLSATDPDGDSLTFNFHYFVGYVLTSLPNTHIDYVSRTSANFWFSPDESQGGKVDTGWFTVHDGANPYGWDSDRVIITVTEVNDPPVLAAIGAKFVEPDSLLKFEISATDPEAGTITLTTSTLPDSARFTDSLNGKGTFEWIPTAEQAGIDSVMFYASDGTMIDSERVVIEVYCCDLPGDANGSGKINMLDITYIINYLYKGGSPSPCRAEGDVDGNGITNMLDVMYLINYLYKYGPAPNCGSEASTVTDIDGNIYHK